MKTETPPPRRHRNRIRRQPRSSRSVPSASDKTGREAGRNIDVHKKKYVFVCQYDGQSPKAPQKLDSDKFLAWIAKQAGQVGEIHTCYEAGCFGFVLHRKLEALGVHNLVVRPRDWDVPRSLGDDTRAQRRHTDRRRRPTSASFADASTATRPATSEP